jgi:GH15 family glucan-1,4-alpha-glucosidase
MGMRLEDYALLGDTQTAALVARDGSIDWLCLPRFDSAACFAALVGTPENGRWRIAPRGRLVSTHRRYRPGTLVLETELESDEGVVRIIDFMPPRDDQLNVVRIVEGVRGRVPIRMELVARFDYGAIVPWVRKVDGATRLLAGPEALTLRTPLETRGEDLTTVAETTVGPGQRVPFVLTWHRSWDPPPPALDPEKQLAATETFWRDWSAQCSYHGPWREDVIASLRVLKALTYEPTGGIVAAPTTSLPERPGGVRNWDYRYCWLRDSTLTLYALRLGGYRDEAIAWREWLLRAVAGDPSTLQIMYSVDGERRLTELELGWLPGYESSRPVRIGNEASGQCQLDVYGEVIDTLFQSARTDIAPHPWAWKLVQKLLEFMADGWRAPDEGIWEVRGPRRHFTHSKVMAWVAFDRAVRAVEERRSDGPVEVWRRIRDEIHADVCRHGYDATRNSFVQSYGSRELDASLLLIPMVGFLPAGDPRVVGTVAAVERELVRDGFVMRYRAADVDGLPPGEGAFLACTFWLADAYLLAGRRAEAARLFERLLGLRNDVGLLAEEYDARAGRFVGNFPQALSHLALVNTAFNLSREHIGPADHRPVR